MKRYILKTELNFTAQKPAGNRLRVYNSFKELAARSDYDGRSKYVDVLKHKNILAQLTDKTLNALMTAPSHLDFLQKNSFDLIVFVDGKRYVTNYDPKQMRFVTIHTPDPKSFERLKKIAEIEAQANAFVKQAAANAVAISNISKKNLTAAQTAKLQQAIVDHKFAIVQFQKSLPPEIKIEVKEVQIKNVQQEVSIGIIPVVVYVIAAIVVGGGVTAYVLPKLTQLLADVIRHKNNLIAQQKNIEAIALADKEYTEGKRTKEGRDAVWNEATKGNEQARNENRNMQENSGKTIFTEVKSILIWGTAAFLAVKILPGLFNNKSK